VTVPIPGAVVDTNDIAVGDTCVYGAVGNPFPPTQVHQADIQVSRERAQWFVMLAYRT